jgi:hypothetical protein
VTRLDRTGWLQVALVVLVGSAWPASASSAETDVREVCEVPAHGGVGLEVPRAWSAGCRPLAKPASARLSFKPKAGASFDLQVTAVWIEPGHRNALEDGTLRRSVQDVAALSLPRAVESTAALEELRGPEAAGYVFTLTDKAPAPGEFAYLTQGSFSLGELQIIFTLLTRDARSADRERALRLLREARFLVKGGDERP